MKLIKFLLMALVGLVALWVGLMLLGLVGTIIHVAFWLALLYIVGMIIWKLIGGSSGSNQKTTPQIDAKRQMENLKEASIKLEEIKRQQRLKQ